MLKVRPSRYNQNKNPAITLQFINTYPDVAEKDIDRFVPFYAGQKKIFGKWLTTADTNRLSIKYKVLERMCDDAAAILIGPVNTSFEKQYMILLKEGKFMIIYKKDSDSDDLISSPWQSPSRQFTERYNTLVSVIINEMIDKITRTTAEQIRELGFNTELDYKIYTLAEIKRFALADKKFYPPLDEAFQNAVDTLLTRIKVTTPDQIRKLGLFKTRPEFELDQLEKIKTLAHNISYPPLDKAIKIAHDNIERSYAPGGYGAILTTNPYYLPTTTYSKQIVDNYGLDVYVPKRPFAASAAAASAGSAGASAAAGPLPLRPSIGRRGSFGKRQRSRKNKAKRTFGKRQRSRKNT